MIHWLPIPSMSSSKSAQWHLKPHGSQSYFIYPSRNTAKSDRSPCKSAATSRPLLPICQGSALLLLSCGYLPNTLLLAFTFLHVLPPNDQIAKPLILRPDYTKWVCATVPATCNSLRAESPVKSLHQSCFSQAPNQTRVFPKQPSEPS